MKARYGQRFNTEYKHFTPSDPIRVEINIPHNNPGHDKVFQGAFCDNGLHFARLPHTQIQGKYLQNPVFEIRNPMAMKTRHYEDKSMRTPTAQKVVLTGRYSLEIIIAYDALQWCMMTMTMQLSIDVMTKHIKGHGWVHYGII